MNKIDVLAEKVQQGRLITCLTEKYPHIFPDYESFSPSSKSIQ